MASLPRLIAVVGTNASGKSGLGVELALRYQGEVISADSRQVYRGLDLGSGKITPEEMRGVPHHLLDVCAPGAFFTMADFQALAYQAAEGIQARGRRPFLVGGTGLYISAVCEGYTLSETPPDLAYRSELEQLTTPQLYALLCDRMPNNTLDSANRNRVMRALEKLHDGDAGPGEKRPRFRVLKLGVTWPKEVLSSRIDARLERRMEQGLLNEVQALLDAGISPDFLRRLGLEYRYVSAYLLGELPSQAAMVEELARAIKRFAKRQMTWFRRDPDILWLDMAGDPLAQACEAVEQFIGDES